MAITDPVTVQIIADTGQYTAAMKSAADATSAVAATIGSTTVTAAQAAAALADYAAGFPKTAAAARALAKEIEASNVALLQQVVASQQAAESNTAMGASAEGAAASVAVLTSAENENLWATLGVSKATEEMQAQWDASAVSAAADAAAYRARVAALNEQTVASTAAAEVEARLAAQAQLTMDAYAPQFAQLAKVQQAQRDLNAANEAGLLVGAEQQAQYLAASEKLAAEEKALLRSTGAVSGLSAAMGALNTNNSRTMYSLSALISDLATGQFSRARREVAALVNELGLLRAAMQLLGWVGLVAGIAAVGAALYEGSKRAEEYEKAIVLSGNASGVTAGQLEAMAGSSIRADEGLLELVKSGKIVGSELPVALAAVNEYMDLTGAKAAKAADEVVKFATAPTPALVKMNEQFHAITPAIADQIVMLQQAGDTAGATSLKIEALQKSLAGMQKEVADSGGYVRAFFNALDTLGSALKTVVLGIEALGDPTRHAEEDFIQAKIAAFGFMEVLLEIGNPLQISALRARSDAAVAGWEKELVALRALDAEDAKRGAAAGQAVRDSTELANGILRVKDQADALGKTIDKNTLSFKGDNEALVKHTEQMLAETLGAKMGKDAYAELTLKIMDYFAADMQAAKAADASAKAHKDAKEAATEHAKAVREAAAAETQLSNIAEHLAATVGGPLEKAYAEHAATLKQINDLVEKVAAGGGDLVLAELNAADATDAANQKLQNQLDVIQSMPDALDVLNAKYAEDLRVLGMNTEQRRVYVDTMRAERDAYELLAQKYKGNAAELEKAWAELKPKIDDATAAFEKNSLAVEANMKAIKDAENIAKNLFDSLSSDIAKTMVEGGSFMSSLKNTAKQTVEAIIAEFLKLEFLGPFMHALFDDAANGMGYAAAGFSGMQGVGGLVGSLFGGSGSIIGSVAGDLLGGGSSSGGNNLLGDVGAINQLSGGAGNGIISSLWGDVQSNSLFQSVFGSTADGGSGIMGFLFGGSAGLGGAGAMIGGADTGGSALLSTLGITDWGAAAGGGAVSASAGVGATSGLFGSGGSMDFGAIGADLGGLFGGYALGSALGGSTGGIIGAGAGAVAAYFVPVIGWALGAMSLINSLTGGGLFGTSWGVTGGAQTMDIGASGASVSTLLDESRKKALFGGHSYRTVSTPTDQAAIDAANQFFDALQKGTTDFAAQFGLTVANVVGGTFTQNFDKNGKPTTTTDTVLGQTYTGETQAQFASRLQAESEVAVLDQLGVNATAYSQAFIGNADNLLKAIQDLGAASLAAYADINKGLGLLGPSGNLGAVMSEVEKLDQSGETLANAYKRLVTENDAWKASIESTIITMGKSATTTLEFADALAKAFGSASAMQTALATFDKNFYSSGQGEALKIANDKAQLATLGAGIGQNPAESAAQFFAAFSQVEATLSPDQLAKWINFGNLLAQVNGEVSKAATDYASFMAKFEPATSGFEQAMQKVSDTLAANIAQANSLAQANGAAGASAADIGKIISASVMQGVQAVQALETEAANLSQTLFQGDLASQITKLKAEANAGNGVAGAQLMALLKQQADAQAGATRQQQFLQASTLLGDLGQIGAITGQSLGDFAKMFGIPLDKFASILGTDQSGLKAEFAKQEEMAKSALETAGNTKYSNELQADILATLQGAANPFSTADLYAALTGNDIAALAAPGGKPGPGRGTGGPVANSAATSSGQSPSGTPGDPVTTKNPDTTTAVTNLTNQIVPILKDLRDRTVARDRYYGPRNSRPIMA